ncbi:MAG TPA: hypothetical protein VGP53_07600, partial [Acidimicrobiales bacterium]|nr:hypothetical protein [Acidimicrobiales bacterium]
VPGPVEATGSISQTPSPPPLSPVMPVSSNSEQGTVPLLAIAALVGLAGAGLLAHRHPRTWAHRAGSLR